MKNWSLALTALILMIAIEPITDCVVAAIGHWKPIACVLIVGAVWLVWCRYERKGSGNE